MSENMKENLVDNELTYTNNAVDIHEKHTLLDDDCQRKKFRYLSCLFMIGFINNLGYVLVTSSAQNLANNFGMGDFMGFFQFCLIFCSAFTRIINSSFLLNIKHKWRILAMLILSIGAYVILGISNMTQEKWGFILSLFGSLLIGICSSLGESVILGFLKSFPSKLVTGWSSGTGMAGVGGAGIYLGLRTASFPDKYIFLVLIPVHAVYWLCFFWINRRKNIYNNTMRSSILSENLHYDDMNKKQSINNNDNKNDEENENHEKILKKNPSSEDLPIEEVAKEEEEDVNKNQKLSSKAILHVLKKIGFYCGNLGLVYFLEYSIISGYADRAHLKTDPHPDDWVHNNAYVVLGFCYQFGVLISRSSLYVFKVKKVWIITLLQLFNFVLWLFIPLFKFMNIYIQFVLMIWVGLMGGCSYVNVMYLILEDPFISKNEKELSVNLCTVTNDTGVLLSAVYVLLMDNTFFKN